MAEKKVSVRLVAVGGQQVKAELQGIGDAGSKSMGQLSRAVDSADERLAAFAARARVALAAAAAAVTAAGVAMVKSALQGVDAAAKLAASLGTTVESIQVLERAAELAGVPMSTLEQGMTQFLRRLSQAAAGTGPAVEALQKLRLSARDLLALPLDQRIAAIDEALKKFIEPAERAAIAGKVFGEQASLALSRIDTSTLRQAAQDIRDFGVAVSAQDAAQIERTNDALSRLSLIWKGLANQLAAAVAPALENIADLLAAVTKSTGPVGEALRDLIGNLDRVITYIGTFLGILAGQWVARLAAAALSVQGLATALVALRVALIRTGIGALIVGVGEAIYQFGRLVSAVGSVGEAMRLLRAVASEVWDRIRLGISAVASAVSAVALDIAASAADAMQSAVDAAARGVSTIVAVFRGAVDAISAVLSELPATIGSMMSSAINIAIENSQALLNTLIARLNGFLDAANQLLESTGASFKIPTLEGLPLGASEAAPAPAMSDLAAAAKNAFRRGLEAEPIWQPSQFLGSAAVEARAAAEARRNAARDMLAATMAPLESIRALQDAVSSTGRDASRAADTTGAALNRMSAAVVETAVAAPDTPDKTMEKTSKAAEKLRDSVVDTFDSMRTAAQNVARDISEPIKDALRSGELSWRTFADAVLQIGRNLASRLIDVAFAPIEEALTSALRGVIAGGPTGILSSLFGFASGGVIDRGSVHAFADGGVVDRGSVYEFARGGVVSRPMIFPLARGIGLVGEAGPEAILPLRRGADGRLGVEARVDDGDGGPRQAITIHIDARGADAGAAARLRAAVPQLTRALHGLARAEAARSTARS